MSDLRKNRLIFELGIGCVAEETVPLMVFRDRSECLKNFNYED